MNYSLNMDLFHIGNYPNGELCVYLKYPELHITNSQTIDINLLWPDPISCDVMLPLLMADCVQRIYGRPLHLYAPYLPYLRQDRQMKHGDTIGSSVFIDTLLAKYDRIYTWDAHSIPHCRLISTDLFRQRASHLELIHSNVTYVSPDKNSPYLAAEIVFNKVRTNDGIEFTVDYDAGFPRTKACIVDDLCDGGATFIALSKELRNMGFSEVYLFITHGFFTRGVDHLFNNGIDRIYTTNTVNKLQPIEGKLWIL